MGTYLKLVFTKQPRREGANLAGQVAITYLNIFGQAMPYSSGVSNEATPILSGPTSNEVDRVLLEMGVPLQQPTTEWEFSNFETSDALTYAPVDDETR